MCVCVCVLAREHTHTHTHTHTHRLFSFLVKVCIFVSFFGSLQLLNSHALKSPLYCLIFFWSEYVCVQHLLFDILFFDTVIKFYLHSCSLKIMYFSSLMSTPKASIPHRHIKLNAIKESDIMSSLYLSFSLICRCLLAKKFVYFSYSVT